MTKDGRNTIDRLARVLGVLGLLISTSSLGVAGWAAWLTYKNRADAAEQISIRIATIRGEPVADIQIPTDALVTKDRTVTVAAKRKTWDVLISNTSLSADMTLIGIWPGQKYTAFEPIYDELTKIRVQLIGVPALPITLGPSKTTSFRIMTDIPISSDHIPFVQVSTSRGGQFVGTPTP